MKKSSWVNFILIIFWTLAIFSANVSWLDTVRVQVNGNSLIKTDRNGWDGAGFSADGFTGNGEVQFEAAQTNANFMCGLSPFNLNASYTSIHYAIYLVNNSRVYIYENGTSRGHRENYVVGDLFQVERNGTAIRYKKNNVVFYTSTIPCPAETGLFADCSLYTIGGELKDVALNGIALNPPGTISDLSFAGAKEGIVNLTWTEAANNTSPITRYIIEYGENDNFNLTTEVLPPFSSHTIKGIVTGLAAGVFYKFRVKAENGMGEGLASNEVTYATLEYHDVTWLDTSRVTVNGSSLTKNTGSGWNGGGVSEDGFTGDGFVQFEAAQTDCALMCGLSEKDPDYNYNTIQYAIYLTNGGAVYIYENGSSRGNRASYEIGDLFQVERIGTTVLYRKNASVIYTSTIPCPADTGLFVDCSLNTLDGILKDVTLAGIQIERPGTPSELTFVGATNGQVRFTWIAAVNNTSDITKYIIEYGENDQFNLSAEIVPPFFSKKIEGTVAGLLPGVSYKFRVKAENAEGVGPPSNEVYYTTQNYISVSWLDTAQVSVNGSSLTKTSGSGWTGGGVSEDGFTDDGVLQFEAAQTNAAIMCGLSSTDPDVNYTSIDYAIYMMNGGGVRVYENGVNRGNRTTYQIGDFFQIERVGTVIQYKKNETVFYTSSIPCSASIGLFADCSLNTNGGTLKDAAFYGVTPKAPGTVSDFTFAGSKKGTLSFSWTAAANNTSPITRYIIEYGENGQFDLSQEYLPPFITKKITKTVTGLTPGATYNFRLRAENAYGLSDPSTEVSYTTEQFFDITWLETVRVSVNGNTLTKTTGNGWNGGGFSEDGFTGNGVLHFEAAQTNKSLMCGLSESNTNVDYRTIQWAIYLVNNGRVYIYENGTSRGNRTNYIVGDTFQVERAGSSIRYLKNQVVFYTSTVSSDPDSGLFADCSLNTNGGILKDAAFYGVNLGPPGAVNNLTAREDTGSVHLAWNRPPNNCSAITNYQVQYGSIASGEFGSSVSTGTSTQATISGLTNGLAYQFRVVSTNAYGDSPPSNIVTILPVQGEFVFWKDKIRIFDSETDNMPPTNEYFIRKTTRNGWNGGAASVQTIYGNGAVQFEAAQTNRALMCGLSENNVDADYRTIGYAIYLLNNGQVRVYEAGRNRGTFGTYQTGDIFQVERVGTTVKYLKNQTVFYTSVTPNGNELLVDCSLNTNNGILAKTKIFSYHSLSNFQAIASDSESIVNLSWINPTAMDDPGFSGTMIRYSLDAFPSTIHDGILLGEFNTSTESAIHHNVLSEKDYYYSIFSRKPSGEYGYPIVTQILTPDLVPPDPVSNLTATPAVQSVLLTWANPNTLIYPNEDLAGILIKRSTTGFPLNENEGEEVARLTSIEQTYTDTNLTGGVIYYYSFFSIDEIPHYSQAVTISAIPLHGMQELILVPASGNESRNVSIPVQTAGTELFLKAVLLNAAGEVVSTFNELLNIDFSVNYPASQANLPVTLKGASLPSPVALSFTQGISEPFSVVYKDVGVIQINASGKYGLNESELYSSQTPLEIKYAPFAFFVNLKNPSSAGHEITDKPFDLEIKAVASDSFNGNLADNPVTPSYNSSNVLLTADPVNGSYEAGVLSKNRITISQGMEEESLQYPEWGVIRIVAIDPDYFGKSIKGVSTETIFTPDSFLLELSPFPDKRNFFYVLEEIEMTTSVLSYQKRIMKNYQNTVIYQKPQQLSLSPSFLFSKTDMGMHRFMFASSQADQFVVKVQDQHFPNVLGETGVFEIKYAEITVEEGTGVVGEPTLVKVRIVDKNQKTVVEDNSTSFVVRIKESNPNGSVSSSALTSPVLIQGGIGVFYITDMEAESVEIIADSIPELPSRGGMIDFNDNISLGKGGIRIVYWREAHD